ncbi:MAG: hydroxyacylglutathione hydrolase [Planctomycetota bacterium]|jgi:hydroxyacylglutathione hydrolase
MGPVVSIRAFGDNLIYVYQYEAGSALAVDPGDSSAVLKETEGRGLQLRWVLCTHHHWDHVGGVVELKRKTGCSVAGGDERIPGIDRVVVDGEVLSPGGVSIRVVGTPGHTRTSVCYYMPAFAGSRGGAVWTGDTMFTGGCGRIFECDARSMWDSLQRLSGLPDDTVVYPGHDYTAENYEFALCIEPGNEAVRRRLQQLRRSHDAGGQVVFSTIGQEKQSNVFLRADTEEVKNFVEMAGVRVVEVFAELRRRKDAF